MSALPFRAQDHTILVLQGHSVLDPTVEAVFDFISHMVFYGILCAHFTHQKMVAGFYGSRRCAIELPGDVNDSSCHEKVDYSCFSALCSGDGAGFLRERFRR